MKTKFYRIANFPNVIGCIDGVLIGIQTPYQDEASYVCRKGFHALNVQAIADAEMKFINVVIRWPGSTHDSFILTNSNISNELEQRNNGWLLGDSGYALKNWLMTPFMHPVNVQQQRYNSAHARTRNIVERSFGVLKSRFRCLDRSGCHLSYQPKKTVHIIGACFSLHNFATEKKMPVPNHDDDDNHDDENNVAMQQPAGRAQEIRNHIASRF
ncbi:putative nuclease HARBI1 isoform X1 [Mercenaria mercenaria]|uniref:putative nuclease HARBI1 isoform X1 n=1 Tax=Mercenaria mercenaria TaxID=6596 RepID=UPI00234E9587|nr:putative nuclease HARBI1 isoform X1 [Mercenaria mercenaria]